MQHDSETTIGFSGGCLSDANGPRCVEPPLDADATRVVLKTPGRVRLVAAQPLISLSLLPADRDGHPVELDATVERIDARNWRVSLLRAVPPGTHIPFSIELAPGGGVAGSAVYVASVQPAPTLSVARLAIRDKRAIAVLRVSAPGRVAVYLVVNGKRCSPVAHAHVRSGGARVTIPSRHLAWARRMHGRLVARFDPDGSGGVVRAKRILDRQ